LPEDAEPVKSIEVAPKPFIEVLFMKPFVDVLFMKLFVDVLFMKLFVEVLRNPFELDISFIFCDVLLSWPLIFFKFPKEIDII
jgi:hypothetical protein